eukprot:1054279-Prorocentrum_minimum.AAC.1
MQSDGDARRVVLVRYRRGGHHHRFIAASLRIIRSLRIRSTTTEYSALEVRQLPGQTVPLAVQQKRLRHHLEAALQRQTPRLLPRQVGHHCAALPPAPGAPERARHAAPIG